MLVEDFKNYTLIEFEGSKFMVTEQYDKVLRYVFGDYMQLPLEEERHPKQGYLNSIGKTDIYGNK